MDGVKMDPSANGNDAVASSLSAPTQSESLPSANPDTPQPTETAGVRSSNEESEIGVGPTSETSEDVEIKPYSLP
jgi:brefeldin A-resistance guanine nucleotide exchange factor 1